MLRGLFGNIPDVTKNLLIVNVLLYLVSIFFSSKGLDLFTILSSHYVNSELFAPYQIVTHMFMHSPNDILHLVFNMLLLAMFGAHLERIWGAKRYFFFYIACGLGAFVLYNSIGVWQLMELKREIIANQSYEFLGYKSIYGLNEAIVNDQFVSDVMRGGGRTSEDLANYFYLQTSTMLGASGAIFGLLAGFALLFPNTELMLLFPPIPIKAKYLIGGYLAFEIYSSIYRAGDQIAHLAHVGGAIVGIIIVLIWRKRRKNFY